VGRRQTAFICGASALRVSTPPASPLTRSRSPCRPDARPASEGLRCRACARQTTRRGHGRGSQPRRGPAPIRTLASQTKRQERNLTRHDALSLQREPGAVTLTSMLSPAAAERPTQSSPLRLARTRSWLEGKPSAWRRRVDSAYESGIDRPLYRMSRIQGDDLAVSPCARHSRTGDNPPSGRCGERR